MDFQVELLLSISLSGTSTAENVSLENASLRTNFDGFIDLANDEDTVVGQMFDPNNKPMTVTVPIKKLLDLSESKRYTALIYVSAAGVTANGDEVVCGSTAFESFVIGG